MSHTVTYFLHTYSANKSFNYDGNGDDDYDGDDDDDGDDGESPGNTVLCIFTSA